MFRSLEMRYYQIIIPKESAWLTLNQLGQVKSTHFIEEQEGLQSSQRPFTQQIRRCDDILNCIDKIIMKIRSYGLTVHEVVKPSDVTEYFERINENRERAAHTIYEEIEDQILRVSKQIKSQENIFEEYFHERQSQKEYIEILKKTSSLLGQNGFENAMRNSLGDHEQRVGLDNIFGSLPMEDSVKFQRTVFRITKGNVWTQVYPFESEQFSVSSQDQTSKKRSLFMIIFPLGFQQQLKNKIVRVCDSFQAQRYQISSNLSENREKIKNLEKKIEEIFQLEQLSLNSLIQNLESMSKLNPDSNCSQILVLRSIVEKEKYIFSTLNLFRSSSSVFYGHFWVPKHSENELQDSLAEVRQRNPQLPGAQIIHQVWDQGQQKSKPPTLFSLNEFTAVFQQIVDTYGVPRYREINPGLFTTISFPFLFGVMFGDIAHGALLFFFGLFLIVWEKQLRKSKGILQELVEFRYLIALMGFFATYCGLIYNEFLSVSLNLFGSCYDPTYAVAGAMARESDCVYPIGVDPAWSVAENRLQYTNSLKMKLSVIFGVVQMGFGIILKGLNCKFFKNKIDLYFIFVPQIVFLIVTFGYMDIMILYKWSQDWSDATNKAPSLINIMIQIPLKPKQRIDPPLYGSGVGQQQFQTFLLAMALICVPVMLLSKPLFLFLKKKKLNYCLDSESNDQRKDLLRHQINHESSRIEEIQIEMQNQDKIDNELEKDLEQMRKKSFDDSPEFEHQQSLSNEEHHDMGEIVVHQIIETIEFVLGSISNTASYLRLWALSLAHGQLAEVFFSRTLLDPIENASTVGIIFSYFGLALVTFGVLMCMDSMECFLHSLRLHWVEFQSKFYMGDGYKFKPFSFEDMIKEQTLNLNKQIT